MQLKSMHTWILVVTIAAFGSGMVWYNYTKSSDVTWESSAGAPVEADRGNPLEDESVFSLFRAPEAMPELKFLNRKNREITLEVFKGSFVLLNIWATWCVPCREEMPALNRLQAKLGGPDFEVVALSIDRGPPSIIENFYKELELDSLKVYHDPTGGASYKLNLPGIPATFLIDREGRGIGYIVGPVEWDSP